MVNPAKIQLRFQATTHRALCILWNHARKANLQQYVIRRNIRDSGMEEYCVRLLLLSGWSTSDAYAIYLIRIRPDHELSNK